MLNGPFGVFVGLFMRWMPPKWFLRTMSAVMLAGQVALRIAKGNRNTQFIARVPRGQMNKGGLQKKPRGR